MRENRRHTLKIYWGNGSYLKFLTNADIKKLTIDTIFTQNHPQNLKNLPKRKEFSGSQIKFLAFYIRRDNFFNLFPENCWHFFEGGI